MVSMSACQSKQKVDLVVYNAVVYTVNPSFDTVSAFAVKDGKFVATGTDKEILAITKPNRKLMPVAMLFIPDLTMVTATFWLMVNR